MKYWKHFKTICKHKYYVLKECVGCGIILQGLLHDLSKFGLTEFVSSARYFQGSRSPIEAEKEAIGYSAAWLHHKSHNKHHWEYWTDFDDNGNVIANKMPYKYVVEMICDYIGAGKAYTKDKWTPVEPLTYWNKVRKGRHFHPDTEHLAVLLLNIIANYGLRDFHRFVKSPFLKNDYNKGGNMDRICCFHCGGQIVWDNDFSYEDMGYEGEGIVHICHCSNCGAEIEYRVAEDNEGNN